MFDFAVIRPYQQGPFTYIPSPRSAISAVQRCGSRDAIDADVSSPRQPSGARGCSCFSLRGGGYIVSARPASRDCTGPGICVMPCGGYFMFPFGFVLGSRPRVLVHRYPFRSRIW